MTIQETWKCQLICIRNSISFGEIRITRAQSHLAVANVTKVAQGTWAELTLKLNWEVEQKQSHDGDAECSDDVMRRYKKTGKIYIF